MDLEVIRKQIDAVDREMAILFEKRMELVYQVAEYKYKNNEEIFDAEREKNVIDRNSDHLSHGEYREAYRAFMQMVMDQSRAIQEKIIKNED